MIRAKVYEQQWGGSVAEYVQCFANITEVKKFRLQTGYKVEILK